MPLFIDPALVPYVAVLPRTDVSDPVAARARLVALRADRPPFEVPADLVRERVTPAGVPALAFRPAVAETGIRSAPPAALLPAVVYLHGGGFVMGDAEGDQLLGAQLARAIGGLVLSLDYRLAPEHPYPAAHDDGYAVLRFVAENADALGVDPARIAVAGSSAGACVAAGIAIRARDEGGPALAAQLLEIPVLDDRAETDSARYEDTPLWTRTNMLDSWSHYLLGCGDAVPPYAAPARATDLSGLPPAYVGVCSADPLRDEGIEYARRLADQGVPTELRMSPGLFHGATGMFPDVDACQRARAALLDAAERLLRA
ncbi:alpha/beta hydrolase [Phytohabitans kaempferiae]|uniref:Alpha/beta hydrolase n=1 Tax=Phytohabitans kaempferiae TaxID=1620943 RepID=A0ABV6LYB6_9ACTN